MSDTFQPYCNLRITSSRTRVKYCIWWLSDELITTYHHRGYQLQLLYNRYWRPVISRFCLAREIRHYDGTRLGTSVAVGHMLRYDTIRYEMLF